MRGVIVRCMECVRIRLIVRIDAWSVLGCALFDPPPDVWSYYSLSFDAPPGVCSYNVRCSTWRVFVYALSLEWIINLASVRITCDAPPGKCSYTNRYIYVERNLLCCHGLFVYCAYHLNAFLRPILSYTYRYNSYPSTCNDTITEGPMAWLKNWLKKQVQIDASTVVDRIKWLIFVEEGACIKT